MKLITLLLYVLQALYLFMQARMRNHSMSFVVSVKNTERIQECIQFCWIFLPFSQIVRVVCLFFSINVFIYLIDLHISAEVIGVV